MFGKMKKVTKRLTRVEVRLVHGGRDYPDITEVIDVLPGQTFEVDIGCDSLKEGETIVKRWDWKAGYTTKYEYFYV